MRKRTALVTGGNRGLGFETCRQLAGLGLDVILAARDRKAGSAAAEELTAKGLGVRSVVLDVAQEKSVLACAQKLEDAGVLVDVLVNNAGVYTHGNLLKLDTQDFQQALTTNLLGAFRVCRAFVPAMVKRGYGRVVNVSSGYGSFGEEMEGAPAYCISKAALNALTVKLAQEVPDCVKVNAVCPGWVRTRIGGPDADRSPEEGAAGIAWLATLPDDGPTGGFFRDRQLIPW